MEENTMRIGQVNQDNYKDFLKILGVKNPKNLDKLLGKEENANGLDQYGQRIGDNSQEAEAARMVAAGFSQEGMYVKAGDTSWKRIVDIPDNIKNAFIELERSQFLRNGNGTTNARDGDEYRALLDKYRENIPPSERLAFTYTIRQLRHAEAVRLENFVRMSDPSWRNGQKIDPDILKRAVSGVDFDFRA